MEKCRVEYLTQLLFDKLSLDARLEVLEHLDECQACREAFYELSRARDAALFIRRPYDVEKAASGTA